MPSAPFRGLAPTSLSSSRRHPAREIGCCANEGNLSGSAGARWSSLDRAIIIKKGRGGDVRAPRAASDGSRLSLRLALRLPRHRREPELKRRCEETEDRKRGRKTQEGERERTSSAAVSHAAAVCTLERVELTQQKAPIFHRHPHPLLFSPLFSLKLAPPPNLVFDRSSRRPPTSWTPSPRARPRSSSPSTSTWASSWPSSPYSSSSSSVRRTASLPPGTSTRRPGSSAPPPCTTARSRRWRSSWVRRLRSSPASWG